MPAERRREILFQCGGAARAYNVNGGGATLAFVTQSSVLVEPRAPEITLSAPPILMLENTKTSHSSKYMDHRCLKKTMRPGKDHMDRSSCKEEVSGFNFYFARAELNCFNQPSMPRISFVIKARMLPSHQTSYPRSMRDSTPIRKRGVPSSSPPG